MQEERMAPEVGSAASSSHYLTREVAWRALSHVSPMIEHARHDRSIVGSGFLHVVVMDPGRTPANAHFEDAILCERSFGDRALWDADYAGFARSKAYLSWRTGLDGHTVQNCAPHLLRSGDTVLGGGVCRDGIVVAASGAFPVYDEVFSGTVALWLRALARHAREGERAAPVLEGSARG